MSLLSTLGEVPKSSGDIDNFYIEAQAKSPVPSLQAYKEKAQKAWLAAMRSGLDKEQRKSILTTFSYQSGSAGTGAQRLPPAEGGEES